MILVIDDDIAVRTSLGLLLKQAGFEYSTAGSPSEALGILEREEVTLALLDMNFSLSTSGEEGLQLLEKIKKKSPSLPVILITAWGNIPLAVEGMKRGAADFINKPWNNDYLLKAVRTALDLSDKSSSEGTALGRNEIDEKYDFGAIIGESLPILSLLETAGRISRTEASVLITGESGTGKELLAEAIHNNSSRNSGPFIKVNLGGISSSLFESEMFGHKKGSFTDAKSDREGRFPAAEGGTIFLDEIGDLDLNCQVKMLRVLQDRSFEVLGSSITKTVDVRVISATNRELEKMVETNEFREDLFYRINLITLKIPSLRERPGDIPLLARFFAGQIKKIYRMENLEIDEKALRWLSGQNWPGNIRELKNIVERTVLVSGKEILGVNDFLEQKQKGPNTKAREKLPSVGAMTLEEMEENMIRKTLEFYNGNISQAARSLGLTRSSLYRRMEKFDIQHEN